MVIIQLVVLCRTIGSSRHGQAAGFRRAKVIAFVGGLSYFAPLVRAA